MQDNTTTTPPADQLAKVYDPKSVESAMYRKWLDGDCFGSRPDDRPPDERFTIVIPPPNVTGALHLGHALNNTLQDILVRWQRMRGKNTLWLPGTDHAGIATQAVVERRIRQEEGKTRHQVGREELVKRIWEWKDQYEKRIISQLQLIGCSCDWSRKRFTLDDGLARAVRHTFFKLFRDGFIFRGKRLVNWDVQLQTAVADDEVYHETVKGHFWHFKYPVNDPHQGEPTHVVFATTRPETMLGDVAVAVHPDPAAAIDQRERELRERLASATSREKPDIQRQLDSLEERRTTHLPVLIKLADMARDGRTLTFPLLDSKLPLITDEWADPLLGSGCVKITPAHDHNDYEVGLRHNLPLLNVMTPDGLINSNGGKYASLTMAEARTRCVEDMEALGLLEKAEDKEIELAHSDRSKTPIEPYLSDQWFLKMSELAEPALDAVNSGKVKIFPERYAKTYLDWLGEKRDWCISRQLWWGHRIPVWSSGVRGLGSPGGDSRQQFSEELTQIGDITLTSEQRKAVHVQTFGEAGSDVLHKYVCVAPGFPEIEDSLEEEGFTQDPDVLDTWFSSALWPHSTLGWPDETDDLKYYYPTSVLVTSRDIITLWVVRMVATGLYNLGKIPFHHVYIHTKILDGRGETMSKSKGNGVDPLDVVNQYGADALRYSIAEMATETQDVRMPVDYVCPHCANLIPQTQVVPHNKQPSDIHKVRCNKCKAEFATQWAPEALKNDLPVGRETSEKFETGRNFCNKLWNSARFAFMNLEDTPCEPLNVADLPPEDRWILARLSQTARDANDAVERYAPSAAIKLLRDFFWDSFCDWYIELSKPRLRDAEQCGTARQVLAFVLDQVLRLLSPFTPFITERLWEELNRVAPRRGLPGVAEPAINDALMLAPLPPADGYPALDDARVLTMFEDVQQAIRGIRDLRNKCKTPTKDRVKVTIKAPADHLELIGEQSHVIEAMASVSHLTLSADATRPANAGTTVVGPLQIFVHDISDDTAERRRLEQELASIDKRLAGAKGKLDNANFLANAKPEVIESERARLAELEQSRQAVQESLAALEG